jgi:hypothetical protein
MKSEKSLTHLWVSAISVRPRRHAGYNSRSLSARQQVNDPTAPNMFARLPAVEEDVLVLATRFFQRIGKDWHSVKRFVCVDAIGKCNDSRCEP